MKARSPLTVVARLRQALLLGLVLLVLALAALFVTGRSRRTTTEPASDTAAAPPQGEPALRARGFDYTQTEGEKAIFRIRGDSYQETRGGSLRLQGVRLTLFSDQGGTWEVVGREGLYRLGSKTAELRGDVVLTGSSGLTLLTPTLLLQEGGKRLESPEPVDLDLGGNFVGKAEQLRVELPTDLCFLLGNVDIHSRPSAEPSLSLQAQRVRLDQKQRLLTASGDPVLRRAGDRFAAQEITLYLAADADTPRLIVATGRARGEIGAAPGSRGGARFSAQRVRYRARPDHLDRRALTLRGDQREPARLWSQTQKGGWRHLEAPRIVGHLGAGGLQLVSAEDGVLLQAGAGSDGAPSQWITAATAAARFSSKGELERATFSDQVVYREAALEARADVVSLNGTSGRVVLRGEPVEVHRGRSRVTAPRVSVDRQAEVVWARGGVRARFEELEDDALAGALPGDPGAPLWVDSRQARWKQSSNLTLFRGSVKAWRGDSVLFADELESGQEQVTARGGVRTVWLPPAEGERQASLQVIADRLEYRRQLRQALYTGAVEAHQAGRRLQCKELELELGEQQRPRIMICSGEASLTTPGKAETARGERAVYDVAAERLEMTGSPVTLSNAAGSEIRGRLLTYDLSAERVEVRGEEEAPSERTEG